MSLTRRYFLKIAAAGAASAALRQTVFAQNAPVSNSPNERIRVALIGCGGRGNDHLAALLPRSDVDLAYLCDVDTDVSAAKAQVVVSRDRPTPKLERDFRKILDDKSVDVVTTATPNHWHALNAILALQAGKHVYSEKPLSHNVWEGRQVVKWADKTGKLCQCGTQSRSSPAFHAAYKYVHEEQALGKIQYAVGTCYKPRKSIGKRAQPLPLPPNLDYDMWCGPAEVRQIFRDKLAYDWHWDFNTGNGDTGNQGIHQMDVARWFLGEQAVAPKVMSIGGRLGLGDAGDTPNTQIIYHAYEKAPLIFETRGLPVKGMDWSTNMDFFRGTQIGVILQCEKGFLVLGNDYSFATAYGNDNQVLKRWDAKEILPASRLPANGAIYEPTADHFANFLEATRTSDRKKLHADCLEGHLSSALCHLGNISYRMGANMAPAAIEAAVAASKNAQWSDSWKRTSEHLTANGIALNNPGLSVGPWLTIDPATEKFTGNPAADAYLSRNYRPNYRVTSPDA